MKINKYKIYNLFFSCRTNENKMTFIYIYIYIYIYKEMKIFALHNIFLHLPSKLDRHMKFKSTSIPSFLVAPNKWKIKSLLFFFFFSVVPHDWSSN